MITPPYKTDCFYSVNLKDSAAQFMAKVFAPLTSKDISAVLVTSIDFSSDVEATNELQSSISAIMKQLLPVSEQATPKIVFNPMYLPNMHTELLNGIEFDSDGDITSIAGFSNPFITMTLKAGSEEYPQLIEARVNFKQFELPSANKLLNPEVNFLS